MKRHENSWNCDMMWRSQLLKFFKLFKLTTKHTKHGQSRTLEISGSFKCMILPPFQSWIRYCLDLLQSLSLLLAAACLIPFHCFSMCFFLKADGAQLWHALPQSLPMHCTLYLLKNGKSSWHLTPCYSFEFSALQCWLFVQLQFRNFGEPMPRPNNRRRHFCTHCQAKLLT